MRSDGTRLGTSIGVIAPSLSPNWTSSLKIQGVSGASPHQGQFALPLQLAGILISTTRSIGSGSGSGPEWRIFQRAKSNPETGICFQAGSIVIWARSFFDITQAAEGALSMK